MTTYKDIPLASDQRNVSQNDIRQNFAYLMPAAAISATGILPVDHYASGDNTLNPTDGFHKQLSLLNRATPANLTNAINSQNSNSIVYTTNDANTQSQLHHYNGTNDFQITPCFPVRALIAFNGAGVALGTPFNCTVAGANPYTVTFSGAGIPSTNYVWFISGVDTSANPLIGKVAVGGFSTAAITITMVNQNNTTSGSVSRVNLMIFGG